MLPSQRSPLPEKWLYAGVIAFVSFFLATSLYISVHRMFWYDEIFTTLTARMSDWHTMWRALVDDNYDPMPFGYFLVARFFDRLFGPGEIGIRVPSALAVAAGMLLTYDITRRISDRLHGFLAVTVLTCSLLPYYSYEGRSYGLYFFLATLALWAWMTERPALVIGAVFLAGVLIHYYMVLVLVPFAADELWRWRPWERPRAKIVAAIVGAMIGVAALTPQILISRKNYGGTFWAKPSFAHLPLVINDLFPPGLLLIGVAVLWIIVADRRKTVLVEPLSPVERISWFFLLIPLVAFFMAKFVTNAYYGRYLIGVVPGVAVAVAALLYRRYRELPRVSLGILAMLAGYGGFLHINAAMHADQIQAFGPAQGRTLTMLGLEDRIQAEGRRYIVIPDQHLLYLEARYYSHHPERYVILVEHPVPPSKHYPFTFWTPEDVRQHYREAAFVEPVWGIVETMKACDVRTVLRFPGLVPVFYME